MTLLAPAALAWLAAVPVLIWLWRLASTQRRIVIPSLVPFQHLLRRAPRRRTRVVVTVLFWLQLAAILATAGALARPALVRPPARTLLAILDTSASMQAGRAFAQARQALLRRLAGKPPGEQVLLMRTAPLGPLLPQATNDTAALVQAAQEAEAVDLGGSLGAAARVGAALLPARPDEILVVTDEPAPSAPGSGVRWVRVGRPAANAANAAIVGVESQGPLCQPADARAIVTVQNFSDRPAQVLLTAHAGREVARSSAEIAPGAQQAMSLEIPQDVAGWVRVQLHARPDALAVDNQAWVPARRTASRPVLLQHASPPVQRVLGAWLNACEAVRWTTEPGAAGGQAVVITDEASAVPAAASGVLVFPRAASPPAASYWMADTGHPVAAYLDPVAAVTAALDRSGAGAAGVPVIDSIAQGQRTPVVMVEEREGRRIARLAFDPSAGPASVPILVTFFNSLRWLMGAAEVPSTGQPLAPAGAAGRLQVHRPDGTIETIDAAAGGLPYERTTRAGLYRFGDGTEAATVAVNFLDPLESNLLEPRSTWEPLSLPPRPARAPARQSPQPLARWLILLALLLLLAEWWRYASLGSLRSLGTTLSEGSAAMAAVPSRRVAQGAPRARPS